MLIFTFITRNTEYKDYSDLNREDSAFWIVFRTGLVLPTRSN